MVLKPWMYVLLAVIWGGFGSVAFVLRPEPIIHILFSVGFILNVVLAFLSRKHWRLQKQIQELKIKELMEKVRK